jgi:hypothetical protein
VSGDGDTRQVISSATMDGSVSYLRFRTQRAAYDAADSRAPRRSHGGELASGMERRWPAIIRPQHCTHRLTVVDAQ